MIGFIWPKTFVTTIPCNVCPFQLSRQFGRKSCFRRSQLDPCSCSSAWSPSAEGVIVMFEFWSRLQSCNMARAHGHGQLMVLVTLGQSSLQLFISKYIGTGSLSFSRGFWITVQDVSGHFSHLHIGGRLEQIWQKCKMLTWASHLRASWSYWYLGSQHAWRLSKSGDFEYHQRCEIMLIVYWGSTRVHLVMVGTASRRVWKTAHLCQMWNQQNISSR